MFIILLVGLNYDNCGIAVACNISNFIELAAIIIKNVSILPTKKFSFLVPLSSCSFTKCANEYLYRT